MYFVFDLWMVNDKLIPTRNPKAISAKGRPEVRKKVPPSFVLFCLFFCLDTPPGCKGLGRSWQTFVRLFLNLPAGGGRASCSAHNDGLLVSYLATNLNLGNELNCEIFEKFLLESVGMLAVIQHVF